MQNQQNVQPVVQESFLNRAWRVIKDNALVFFTGAAVGAGTTYLVMNSTSDSVIQQQAEAAPQYIH
jgi:phosphate starvation-inducible protein PhoH